MTENIKSVAIAVLLMCVGAFFLSRCGDDWQRALFWRPATGTISSISMTQHVSSATNAPRGVTIEHCEYTYSINGTDYVSHVIEPSHNPQNSSTRMFGSSKQKELRLKYYPSAIVPVYYDPKDPSRACLFRSSLDGGVFDIVCFLGFSLLAVLFVVGPLIAAGCAVWDFTNRHARLTTKA